MPTPEPLHTSKTPEGRMASFPTICTVATERAAAQREQADEPKPAAPEPAKETAEPAAQAAGEPGPAAGTASLESEQPLGRPGPICSTPPDLRARDRD